MEKCFKTFIVKTFIIKNGKRISYCLCEHHNMRLMHPDFIAYRTLLVHVGKHYGHQLLVLLSLFLGGDRWNGLCWRTAQLLPCCRANPFLCFLCLPGLAARLGAAMRFAVCGACFTTLHLGLSTTCNMPSHPLCDGHHKG